MSGTYEGTRARNTTSPGSCDAAYKFNPSMPIKIAAAGSGYNVEVGYSDETGAIVFIACTNNVSGCTVAATCAPGAGTDQATFTISGDSLAGTISRIDAITSCTVNFKLTGVRK